MFGTFLLFILYAIASLGVLVCVGIASFFFYKANQGLLEPRAIVDTLKNPTLFLSENDFSQEGNQDRLRFIQFLSISIGLVILILLLRLMLG